MLLLARQTMSLRMLRLLVFLAPVLTACHDSTGPLEPPSDLSNRGTIVDSRNGGSTGFYFLPPIGRPQEYSGTFDPSRSPVVEVCVLDNTTACSGLVARFSIEGNGKERIRVDEPGEAYIVNWTTSADLSLSSIYRIRVLDRGAVAGYGDVMLLGSARSSRSVSPDIIGIVRGSTLPIRFRLEVNSSSPATRLEIQPSAFMLPGKGLSKQLSVKAYDADGNPTIAPPVTWSSTAPSVIEIGATGIATANADGGSAQVTAHAASVASTPALGIVMVPPSGALLLADENVVGPIQPVDPTAAYAPGWRYAVQLTGVTPGVGQLVLSTGEAPIGGRFVSVTPVDGGHEAIIQLTAVSELFANLSLNETIALRARPVSSSSMSSNFASFQRVGIPSPRSSLFSSDTEFNLGPFECKLTAEGPSLLPELESYSFHVDPDFSLEVVHTPFSGFEKVVVRGAVDAGVNAKAIIPLDVEEKVECKTEVAEVHLPSGPLALFIGGVVPVGVGFELGGKIVGANIGVDAGLIVGATLAVGFDCTSVCAPVTEMTGSRNGYLKPILPTSESSGRLELSASAYAWAEAKIGNPLLELLQFKTFDAKIGLTQKFDLANKSVQVGDPAYASRAELSFDTEAGTSTELAGFLALVGIELPDFKLDHSLSLAITPRLSGFTIAPATVNAGDSATFVLTVDSASYLGAYAIDSIELFRKKIVAGSFSLDEVPSPCARIAATSGQVAFSCRAELPDDWEGTQDVYAFVKAKVFGVPLPLLELAVDAKAPVTVQSASLMVSPGSATVASGSTQAFTATVLGLGSQSVTWSATGGTIDASGVFTAGDVSGNFVVVATSDADPGIADTAEVTVDASVSVAIDPANVTLGVGTTRQFVAAVTGTGNQAVIWSATGGTYTISGDTLTYTAGQVTGSYEVRARSLADTTKSAVASVRIGGRISLLANPVDLQAFGQGYHPANGVAGTFDTASNVSSNLHDFSRSVAATWSGSWPEDDPVPAGSGSASGNAHYATRIQYFDVSSLVSIVDSGTASGSSSVSGSRFSRGGGNALGTLRFEVIGDTVNVTVTYKCQVSESGGGTGFGSFALVSNSTKTGLATAQCRTDGQDLTRTVSLAPDVYFLTREIHAGSSAIFGENLSSTGSAAFTLKLEFSP